MTLATPCCRVVLYVSFDTEYLKIIIVFRVTEAPAHVPIEEGFNYKTRQRLLCRIGGQNPCRASCFSWVFLTQTVEFNCPTCRSSCFVLVFLKQMVEFNRLFKNIGAKQLARQGFCPPIQRDDLCLVF